VCVQRGALVYCAEEVDNGKVLPLYVKAGAEPKALDFFRRGLPMCNTG